MACAKDGKITSFFQSSPKDAPLPIRWTAHRHSVVIVRIVPLASKSQDFANGRVPDPLVYMVNTCAALDPMYVDVVSCSMQGPFRQLRHLQDIHLVLTYVYIRTYLRMPSAHSCNCVTHN